MAHQTPSTKRIDRDIASKRPSVLPLLRAIPDALRHFDSLPDSANVRQPIVEALYGFSSATVWRRVKDGRIPHPRKLSDRVTAWNVGELRRALASAPEGER